MGTSASDPRARARAQTGDNRARAWGRELRPTNMVQAETNENTQCFAIFFLEAILASTLGGPWAWVPSPPKCECYEAQGLARGPRPRAMTQGQTGENKARAWARERRPTNMVQAETGENTQCFATFLWKQLLRRLWGGPCPPLLFPLRPMNAVGFPRTHRYQCNPNGCRRVCQSACLSAYPSAHAALDN